MLRTCLGLRACILAASLAALPAIAPAADVRSLDATGRVLTVGPFLLVPTDGGGLLRVESCDVLSWELHDQDHIAGHGVVPGTEGAALDLQPSLSRNPATGDVWLAWSRQPDLGAAREIAWLRFRADGPDPATLASLIAGPGDQVEPSVLHDEAGNAFIAWIDESVGRRVKLLGLSPTGAALGVKDVSGTLSLANSAPRLGINAVGGVFVAYVGADSTSGEPRLYVAARSPGFGGVTHVPNPLIELGVQAALPAPTFMVAPRQIAFTPDLRLTVLGGTAIAWWTETSADNRLLFRYVAEGSEEAGGSDGWLQSSVQTIDLSTGTLGSVPDALELLEARLRRVITTAPSAGGPSLPSPGRGFTRPGLTDRR